MNARVVIPRMCESFAERSVGVQYRGKADVVVVLGSGVFLHFSHISMILCWRTIGDPVLLNISPNLLKLLKTPFWCALFML